MSDRLLIKEVADIGEVVTDDVVEDKGSVSVVKGEIVGVLGCDEFKSCRSCKSKVVSVNEVIGQCSKCGMKAKLSKCAKCVAARIIIEDEEGKEYKVSVFSGAVEDIVQDVEGDDLVERMIRAQAMEFTITKQDVIVAVGK